VPDPQETEARSRRLDPKKRRATSEFSDDDNDSEAEDKVEFLDDSDDSGDDEATGMRYSDFFDAPAKRAKSRGKILEVTSSPSLIPAVKLSKHEQKLQKAKKRIKEVRSTHMHHSPFSLIFLTYQSKVHPPPPSFIDCQIAGGSGNARKSMGAGR